MSSDSEEDSNVCPLCMEEMDLSDKNFLPCPCGYRVCMWCWHHIRENLNGLCPACRTPYNADPHAFSAVDRTEIVKNNRERRQKEKQERKTDSKPTATTAVSGAKAASNGIIERKLLHNYRVIQRNLVYVIGLPPSLGSEEILRKGEYLGQYGKIGKVVVHRNNASHATVSAYVTFVYKDDARASIQALENFHIEGHVLRASFGTTKYCNNFIRSMPCSNPDCVYLHEMGDDEDIFTKEEIQAGQSKLLPTPNSNQTIVTGNGGPSGTGKKPSSEPVFPAPVFLQDIAGTAKPASNATTSNGSTTPTTKPLVWPAVSASAIDKKPSPDQSPARGSGAVASKEDNTFSNKDSMPQFTPLPTAIGASNTKDKSSNEGVNGTAAATANKKGASASTAESKSNVTNTSSAATASSKNDAQLQQAAAAFNGFGKCAVFPVPVSSLAISVWSSILSSSSSSLDVNPYGLLDRSISELFDLTLPPVDACCMVPWPRPLSYYRQGCASDGSTHAPVCPHQVHDYSAYSSIPDNQAAYVPMENNIQAIQYMHRQQQLMHQNQLPPQPQALPSANTAQYAVLQQIFPGVKIVGPQQGMGGGMMAKR